MVRQVMQVQIAAVLAGLGLGVATLLGAAAPAAGRAPTGASAAAATGVPRLPGPAVAPVAWGPCDDLPYDCATVPVPLDHDRPDGPTIGIAVLRVRATSPETPIGSLFYNPGGPGGSGVGEDVLIWSHALPAAVRERFDVVGFDPRGIGRSAPLRCYGPAGPPPPELPPLWYPETEQEEDRFIAGDRALVDACRANAGPILRHMSTADVARDLDLLRQAVGDERLTFYGLSYGSFLGQTYANLFPDRVRALVIDGVIDPRAWVGEGIERWTVPVDTRLRSAESAQLTLEEFFRLCDEAGQGCAFGPDSSDRFERLAQRLRSGPIEVVDGFETRAVTYNDMINLTFGAMHSPDSWPWTAFTLAELERAGGLSQATSAPASPPARPATDLDPTDLDPPVEALFNDFHPRPAVVCADSDNPRGYRWYREAADAAEARSYFGRVWNWTTSECAIWPAEARLDRYEGPWDAWTASPVLVVGNRYDPSTGYHGAVAVSQLLPSSSLITYGGWGHGTFLTAGSACVDEAVVTYLLTSAAPAGDLTCEPTRSPFDPEEEARLAGLPAPAAAFPAVARERG